MLFICFFSAYAYFLIYAYAYDFSLSTAIMCLRTIIRQNVRREMLYTVAIVDWLCGAH